MVIKSVGALSCAKIAGTLYALIGFIAGAGLSLVSLLGGFAGGEGSGALLGAAFGMAAIVLFPIMYGGIGFVVTLITAWLYNVLAGMVGGVELNVQ